MPDTDDYGGFMLMTNVTRSHRGLLGSHILASATARGWRSQETHSVFLLAVVVGSVGNLGQMLRPFFIAAAFSSDLAGRTRTEPGEERTRTLAEETATSHAKP